MLLLLLCYTSLVTSGPYMRAGYPGFTYTGRVCSIKIFICVFQSRVWEVADALCGTNLTYNINVVLKTPDAKLDKITESVNITLDMSDKTPDGKTDLTSHSDNENNNSSPYLSPFKQACPYFISHFDSDDQDTID